MTHYGQVLCVDQIIIFSQLGFVTSSYIRQSSKPHEALESTVGCYVESDGEMPKIKPGFYLKMSRM